MARDSITGLIAQLYGAKISRREFGKRAAAAGLSAGLVGQVLAVHATKAQDGELPLSATIGVPDTPHTTDTSKGTIKLYSSWPYSGAMERIGGHAVAATEMCLEDFGHAAGGFAIEYEALDDGVAANEGRWEPGKETENANRAVNDEAAMVYLGTYNSGAAAISIPILNEAGMAMISFANTGVGLTRPLEGLTQEGEPDIYYPTGKRNYMRVCPADDIQGGAGARWAIAEGHSATYVLHDNSLYGKGVADIFAAIFAEEGGEVLGNEGYDPDAGDYQSLMTSIADLGPDIVYVGATVDNNPAKVLQDMRGVMSAEDVTFLGPDGLFTDTFVQGAADAAEGAWITFGGYSADKLLADGGAGADYVVRVREHLGLGEEEQPDAYSTYAYEAMVVVLQAIERAGVNDRTAILDTMFATEGFVSLLGGTWSFTENGDTDSLKIGLVQVIDGALTFQVGLSS
jgi:branched-chain amino acid transport system substrate-binding protein